MASRLNQLFQVGPLQFLERTVLFTNELTSPEATAILRNGLANNIDLQPIGTRATARVLSSLHLYTDLPLIGNVVPTMGSIAIRREDPPQRFVFLPEFTACRLLVRADGRDWLRLDCEQGLAGAMPPAEAGPNSAYLDSFDYWTYTTGHLVGKIRATAVLVKEGNQRWTFIMQQIAGSAGFEVVRKTFSRTLRY